MSIPAASAKNNEIQLELERILHSSVFRNARRSQRFLRYLVEAGTAQPPIAVKEYTIAIDVFDRGPEYDPAVDATVRVEAGRMRSRLREYYDGEGSQDQLVLEVPKGSYAAVIARRSAAATR